MDNLKKKAERYLEIENKIKFLNTELKKLRDEKKKIEELFLNIEGDVDLGDIEVVKKCKTNFRPITTVVYRKLGWDLFLKVVGVKVGDLKAIAKIAEVPLDELGYYEETPYIKVIKKAL